MPLHNSVSHVLAGALLLAGVATAASATESCPACARSVVTNSSLADCFLGNYQRFESARRDNILVDLSDCPADRSIVNPFRMPAPGLEEPDLRFMVTRGQLACLREKLAYPDAPLDPAARIELEDCE